MDGTARGNILGSAGAGVRGQEPNWQFTSKVRRKIFSKPSPITRSKAAKPSSWNRLLCEKQVRGHYHDQACGKRRPLHQRVEAVAKLISNWANKSKYNLCKAKVNSHTR